MTGRVSSLLWAVVTASASSALAAPPVRTPVLVPPIDMGSAILLLSRQTGVDVFFDHALVRGLYAPTLRGRLTMNEALSRLLAGTGVGIRQTGDSIFVLYALPRLSIPALSGPAVPDILVVGKQTQDADIRRTENDIQVYQVSTRHDIERAFTDQLDDYFRTRVTMDTQGLTASQTGLSTRSEIDLRNLGPSRTLVLVDGRRMPGFPVGAGQFGQPDISGLPQDAIDRIETVTSTADGVSGPGAIGGVVNIILRHDYKGLEINVTTGITDRGDGRTVRIEGHLGFSPDGGRTTVTISGMRSIAQPLTDEDRHFERAVDRRALANDPTLFLATEPTGNGINIFSDGRPLTLRPEYGGSTLSAGYTFLPLGFTGSATERTGLLSANAGMLSPQPALDSQGSSDYLQARPEHIAVLANVRHDFGGIFQLFADGIYMRNSGLFQTTNRFDTTLSASDPRNPFTSDVALSLPLPSPVVRKSRIDIARLTAGIIARLPGGWSADVDYSLGFTRYSSGIILPDFATDTDAVQVLPLTLDPLGNWQRFSSQLANLLQPESVESTATQRLHDLSLRFAGPLATLPGGPLTMTVLGEARRDNEPDADTVIQTTGQQTAPANISQIVHSAYLEFRAPIISRDFSLPPLRGFELQLAARYDGGTSSFPSNVGATSVPPGSASRTRVHQSAVTYTFGAKTTPLPWLLLRGSVATGRLPPSIDELAGSSLDITFPLFPGVDPKRGGQALGSEGSYTLLVGGSPTTQSERARTLSFGLVLNPSESHGPRLSIDYTNIRISNSVVTDFEATPSFFLANEEIYASKIVRAPLTPEDIAMGFSAGRITLLDTRAFNGGTKQIKALDVQLDWTRPIGITSKLEIYGRLSWQPVDREREAPPLPSVDPIGFADGPLPVRANGGMEWTHGSISAGADFQYYPGYRITHAASGIFDSQVVALQGSDRVGSQVYFDVFGSMRIHQAVKNGRTMNVRLGVENLFDRHPPLIAYAKLPIYSTYGDAFGRRFELSVTFAL